MVSTMSRKRVHQTYEITATATDLIHRVGRLLRHQTAAYFRRQGIDVSPEQWRLLLQLAEHHPQSQGQLADPVLNDYPNITRLIDGLERRELVIRKPDPQDRRSVLVDLTETGKSLIDQWLPDVIEEKAKCYDGLTERDVAALRRILAAMENNILKEYA
jgi:DNA-binding MarR family transcriptional regulator